MGTLEVAFRQAGLVYSYVDLFDEIPKHLNLEQVAGLVVLGGPMNVDETDLFPFLEQEVEWIREALGRKIPILGLCLGSQLLAKALGARVYPNAVKEIGWYDVQIDAAASDDPLFADCSETETVFQWHGDTFNLPEGAVRLATSEQCENQAFRYGENAFGLQFHAEMTEELVELWLTEPGNCIELASVPDINPDEIRRRTPLEIERLTNLGHRIFWRFATLCHERRQTDAGV
ncbi:MAG: gamma-glutamyl-gamma-aminobutyrate hydrolase family protein [Pirellulales bacterium]|nr:gamma-glutamyl-gamma-aminobutyrate hydrolase family protein [Pirellulales bacterium]